MTIRTRVPLVRRPSLRVPLAVAAVAGLATATLTVVGGAAVADPPPAEGPFFDRLATYPVFQNVPDGVDPLDETVAEISAITDDGNTMIYTDAAGQRLGFLDITDPGSPVGDGTVDLTDLAPEATTNDEPTSVEVAGAYILAVVDTSDGDFENPSGRVDVLNVSDRQLVASIDLGGQPDAIKVSPDGAYAAIAMENQRDEDLTPPGKDEEGDLPQPPAGFVQLIELDGTPDTWEATPIELPDDELGDVYEPTDAEPEFVDINDDNQAVVTLQENNGLVVIDLETQEIVNAFSLGNAQISDVDTDDDGIFDFTDDIDVPREPDAVAWVGDDLVATANEGDLFGGSRGWSVVNVDTGQVVYDSGNTFEYLAGEYGLFNDGRADNKGAEPEGIAYAEFGGVPHLFVGSERSNFVAVYDLTDPTAPVFRQVLFTTNGPEGLLPVPDRNLLLTSSEVDESDVNVRATIGVFEIGADKAPLFPSLISQAEAGAPADSAPIGWAGLSGLSADPADPSTIYAVGDKAAATGRIYTIDGSAVPGVITDVMEVTDGEETPELDLEGISARPNGGFWLANEGEEGDENTLLQVDEDGVVEDTVELPEDVAAGLGDDGLAGVAVLGTPEGGDEQLTVVLSRPLEGEDVARIGRYIVATETWSWFGYTLDEPTSDDATSELAEVIAITPDTLAVIERDDQPGTGAEIKRVYAVSLPAAVPGTVAPATKQLAIDMLPAMQSLNGWVQEKLEGLAVTGDGTTFLVTDNDGVDDATGETQLFRFEAPAPPPAEPAQTRTILEASKQKVRKGKTVNFKVRVLPATTGTVRLRSKGARKAVIRLNAQGRGSVRLRLRAAGNKPFRAIYQGDADSRKSASNIVRVRILPKKR